MGDPSQPAPDSTGSVGPDASSTYPSRPEDPAAFFFLGAFEPAELANFNLQNVSLPEGGVFEAFGHGVGVWWGSKVRRDLNDVRDKTRDWLETIAALYYLSSGIALGVRLSIG